MEKCIFFFQIKIFFLSFLSDVTCNVCVEFRINGNVGNMGSDVGYCPQVNALDDYMTGRSLLTFYCYVKGLQDAHAVRQHFF